MDFVSSNNKIKSIHVHIISTITLLFKKLVIRTSDSPPYDSTRGFRDVEKSGL